MFISSGFQFLKNKIWGDDNVQVINSKNNNYYLLRRAVK